MNNKPKLLIFLLLVSFGVFPQTVKKNVSVSSSLLPNFHLLKIAENVYMIKGEDKAPSIENSGFMSAAYGILTSEGWVVIDSLGTPLLARKFIIELKKISSLPIRYAIITHYHPDHFYGSQIFQQHGAKIIAHQNLKDYVDGGIGLEVLNRLNNELGGIYKEVRLVTPDILIQQEEKSIVAGGIEFQILPMVPAHTNSDLIIYLPDKKLIFTGDLVQENRIPFCGDRNAQTKSWIKYLAKMKTFDFKLIGGGHNLPMTISGIDFTIGYISYLRNNISQLKEQGKSLDAIKSILSKNQYSTLPLYNDFHNRNIYDIYMKLDLEELME